MKYLLICLLAVAASLAAAQPTAVIQTNATFPYCAPVAGDPIFRYANIDFDAIGGDTVEWKIKYGPGADSSDIQSYGNGLSRNRRFLYNRTYYSSFFQRTDMDTLSLKVWNTNGHSDSTYFLLDIRDGGLIYTRPFPLGVPRGCTGDSLNLWYGIDFFGIAPASFSLQGPARSYFCPNIRNWSNPSSCSSMVMFYNLSAADEGIYHVRAEQAGCTVTDSFYLHVFDPPTAVASSSSPVCVGDEIHLSSQGSFAPSGESLDYRWRKAPSFYSFQANPTIQGAQLTNSGNYILEVFDRSIVSGTGAGCSSPPAFTFVQVVDCTDVEEGEDRGGISLYPNPTTGHFTIEAAGGIEEYMVYDMQGRRLMGGAPNGASAQVDGTGLAAGMYMVGVKNPEGFFNLKLIINNN